MNISKRWILIGGAPTTGKSTLAAELSKRLQLPWMSTDQIRDMMRTMARREDYPDLFNPEGYSAERFLTEFSAEQIVDMEIAQGAALWPVVRSFIQTEYSWTSGGILEGVNILPQLVAQDFGEDQSVRALFLVDSNPERIRNVVYTRGLWDKADTYSDDVKEKEVEWTMVFSHRTRKVAEQHGYPCLTPHVDVEGLIQTLE